MIRVTLPGAANVWNFLLFKISVYSSAYPKVNDGDADAGAGDRYIF